VLLVHDAGPDPGPAERQAISWTCDLLGHFDTTVTVAEVQSYRPGSINSHDATICLGLRPGMKLPDAFLTDCARAKTPLCWIGANVDQLILREPAKPYGFLVEHGPPEAQAARVTYKDASYWRDEAPLPSITITASDLCRPIALVDGQLPYAVRSGDFWYFSELPLRPAHAPGAHLVICDQMHAILDEPHDISRTALLFISDVTPETDPGKLDALTRQLQAEEVPFAIEIAPAARQPDSGELVRLDGQRRLVSILRGAQRAGASIIGILPGLESSDESPAEARTDSTASRRFQDALAELARCGLYPVAWSANRLALSDREASQLVRLCSTILDRQSDDTGASRAPPMPFLIAHSAQGQRIMPDNLPQLRHGRGEVEAMQEAARSQAATPDPWVTAGIAPAATPADVALLLDGLRAADYGFYDLRFAGNSTMGDSIVVRTVSDQRRLGDILPKGWDAMVLGPDAGARSELDHPGTEQLTKTVVHPGAILVAYPSGSRPKVVLSVEGDAQQVTQRGVQQLAQLVVMFAVAAAAVLFLIYVLQLVQRRGA
jgi:hypothetical protein